MNTLKQLTILCLMLIASVPSLYAKDGHECLKLLDQEVARYPLYIKKQEEEITRLRGNLKVAFTLTDRYLSTKQLAIAYSKFNSDSALFYYKKCQDMGLASGNKEWCQEASIDEIRIYADRGDDFSATNILNKMGSIEGIVPSLRPAYASASLLRFIKYQSTLNNDSLTLKEAQDIWAELSPYLDKNDPSTYLYYINYYPNYNAKSLEQTLRKLLKKQNDHFKSAMGYLVLYNVLEKEGRDEEAFEALVHSAIADLKAANRSSSSLLHTVELLYAQACDYKGLSAYVSLCLDNVANYKDVGRCLQLVSVQKQIENLQAKKSRQHIIELSAVIGGLLMGLLFLGGLLYRSDKKSQKKQALYLKQDQDLAALSSELKRNQEELKECLERGKYQNLKDKYSDAMFVKSITLWSSILKDERSFKKEIANFLQAGLNRKARDLVNKTVSADQSFNQFFVWFDEVYLSLHADFVEKLNEVMGEEHRFVLEEKNTLTPELRIFALISLGITDTTTIADNLHYSSQTVYNYRSKVSHGTKQPKFDLVKYVSNLYRKP